MSAIGVVVVAYRSDHVLGELLSSLVEHQPGVATLVVDNAGDLDHTRLPEQAHLVVSPRNLGFGGGCNLGARELLARGPELDHLVFLNPDVRLQGPSLTELATQLGKRPGVGVATGPLIDEHGVRVPAAWGPRSPLRAFWSASGLELAGLRRVVGRVLRGGSLTSGASTSQEDLHVDGYVVGGAMIVRRTCWEQIGGFDEDFFLFGEDADLCARARGLGWEVRVLPATAMVHLRGSSTVGATSEERARSYGEGLRTYASKHLTPGAGRRLLAAHRLGSLVGRVRAPRS